MLFISSAIDASPAATRHLEALGAVALRAPTFRTAEDAIARHAGLAALVYLHRIGTAGRYAGLARHHHPQARLLFVAHVRQMGVH